ncbi:hypothetical protein DERP_007244 [Dermatophagoides pteronyssinus]|uniref:Uncharacterized protein n=1 Tax=Dermatophagoides pteronyssinus TaxID=6956 RepID=A0ABQ8J3S9_DERPT|nr:hypothetical protein DERP_007244 [Dermatophagoides pteronyssinus]
MPTFAKTNQSNKLNRDSFIKVNQVMTIFEILVPDFIPNIFRAAYLGAGGGGGAYAAGAGGGGAYAGAGGGA